jgi:accessory gene regulator B
MILLTVSAILVWMFAPVDHPNKPIINPNRRKYLKYLSAAVFVILASFTFIMGERFAATAVAILFMEALLLFAGHFAQRRILV